jgi:hypothetical protein
MKIHLKPSYVTDNLWVPITLYTHSALFLTNIVQVRRCMHSPWLLLQAYCSIKTHALWNGPQQIISDQSTWSYWIFG